MSINSGLLTLAGVIVGSLLTIGGSLLTTNLSAKRERRRWILDKKAAEYRKLLNKLFDCLDTMFPDTDPTDAEQDPEVESAAFRKGAFLLRSQIFVDSELTKGNITESWDRLDKYREPELRSKFEGDLRTIMRKDLNLNA